MGYEVIFNKTATKAFKKLDRQVKSSIAAYIDNKLLMLENPKSIGKLLLGNYMGKWRYRVGKYRVVCNIDDSKKIIEILNIVLREEAYKYK